jgi:hypothetical protein
VILFASPKLSATPGSRSIGRRINSVLNARIDSVFGSGSPDSPRRLSFSAEPFSFQKLLNIITQTSCFLYAHHLDVIRETGLGYIPQPILEVVDRLFPKVSFVISLCLPFSLLPVLFFCPRSEKHQALCHSSAQHNLVSVLLSTSHEMHFSDDRQKISFT